MVEVISKVNYIAVYCLFLLVSSFDARSNSIFNLEHSRGELNSIWNILQRLAPPFSTIMDPRSRYFVGDVPRPSQIDVFEDDEENLSKRAALHRACKVIREILPYEDDEYEYFPRYENVSCTEAHNEPTSVNLPHSEQYCYIIHHPTQSVSCETRIRSVRLFRKKFNARDWSLYNRINLGVGCGCALGLTYAEETA